MPGFPGADPPDRWTVVAGLAAVQVPAVNGPGDFAGLPPAGWTHPLRAEPVAAGTLASLGHRNLTPGLLRQFTAALLHGPPLRSAAARPPAWACGGARSPDAPEMLRTGPGWLQRPDRGAAGNVQHLAHPQRRQSLPEGRPHPEGVVPGNPSGPQMSPLQGPLHHLQRQLGLRPVALPLLRNPRRLTPVLVRGPAFRQIKPLVHQGPSQRTDAGQEHSGLAAGHLAQSPGPVSRSTDGPLPPTSCPAWGSRCRPAPTPPPGVPTWAISTPATGQSPRHPPG